MRRYILNSIIVSGLIVAGVGFFTKNHFVTIERQLYPTTTQLSTTPIATVPKNSQPVVSKLAQSDVPIQSIEYPKASATSPAPSTIRVKTADGYVDEPNIAYHALYTPNDIKSTQWYTTKISAPQVWDKTTGSSSTIVAIIDTGFALNNDELSTRWAINSGESGPTNQEGPAPNCTSRGLPLDKSCNNLDDDNDGYVDNWRGWDFNSNDNDPMAGVTSPTSGGVTHGTNTSGLVGAAGNNMIGAVSLNWQTQLMPLQALDDTGGGYTSTVATAIHYAVDHGANVISMSLGSSQADDVLRTELDYAAAHNVTVVAAAGNDGCDCLSYPANYPDVIAVGATDSADTVASFSSYGANLDVVAPGSGLLYTTSWTAANPQSSYTTGNIYGTSFSTPIVAGLAALLKGVRPDATPSMISGWITGGADALSSSHAGSGRINAYRSLLLASPNIANSTPARTTPVFKLTKSGASTIYTSDLDDKASLTFKQGYVYSIMRFAPY